jgi:uncharacterized protein (TIGR00251 family)
LTPDPAPGDWVRQDGNDLVLSVRVQPRASKNEILGVRDGRLRLRTTASPTDGKANQAVIKLIAVYLYVAPSRIRVMRGKAQRNKQLCVTGPVSLPRSAVPGDGANGL